MTHDASISPLEAHLGYWLRFVSNHVSHSFKLTVEARGVTVAEWVILRELLRLGETNPSQLAASLGMTRGTISKLIDRLEAKRFVKRRVVKGDQRFQVVALTAPGKKLLPGLAALADRNDAEFFGHLSTENRSALMDLLKEIVRRNQLKDVPVN